MVSKNPLRRSEFGFEPFKGQGEGDVLDVFVWMWGQKEWKEREGGEVKGQTPLAEKCFCEQKNCSVVKENIVVGWVGVGVPKRPDPLKPTSGTESGMFQGEGKAASRLCTSRLSCTIVFFQAVLHHAVEMNGNANGLIFSRYYRSWTDSKLS